MEWITGLQKVRKKENWLRAIRYPTCPRDIYACTLCISWSRVYKARSAYVTEYITFFLDFPEHASSLNELQWEANEEENVNTSKGRAENVLKSWNSTFLHIAFPYIDFCKYNPVCGLQQVAIRYRRLRGQRIRPLKFQMATYNLRPVESIIISYLFGN